MNAPIHARSMFVSLNQAIWQAQATDRDIAAKAEAENEADTGTMKVIKELTPKHYIIPIRRTAQIGREEHRLMTLPGLVRGQQLLATETFERYVSIQGEIRDRFWECVDKFIGFYPSIVEKAPQRLGTAFKKEDFPSATDIRTYFKYDLKFSPVPEVNNWFLEGLSEDETNQLRHDVRNEVETMYQTATREMFERARECLTNLAKQAETYDGTQPSLLRDSTIFHAKELAELVIGMNITNDPLLAKIGSEMIENFHGIEAKDLRGNKTMRDKLAAVAKGIIVKIPG